MIGNKKILAIVTARKGSKGIPCKNYRDLFGKPLFVWSMLAGMDSKYVDMIKGVALNYVALEDNEKALEFIGKAREQNPDDYNLIIEEGNIYFKMGNNEKFKEKLGSQQS